MRSEQEIEEEIQALNWQLKDNLITKQEFLEKQLGLMQEAQHLPGLSKAKKQYLERSIKLVQTTLKFTRL